MGVLGLKLSKVQRFLGEVVGFGLRRLTGISAHLEEWLIRVSPAAPGSCSASGPGAALRSGAGDSTAPSHLFQVCVCVFVYAPMYLMYVCMHASMHIHAQQHVHKDTHVYAYVPN